MIFHLIIYFLIAQLCFELNAINRVMVFLLLKQGSKDVIFVLHKFFIERKLFDLFF